MGRSGYSDDIENDWSLICYRGAVKSAIRGKRGQGFLRELLAALDALPEKRLIAGDLEKDGAVCALGAIGRARGIDMSAIDPEDTETVAGAFDIAESMAREIVFENDDDFGYHPETPEERYARVRKWVEANLLAKAA